jgi:hypothetical protein
MSNGSAEAGIPCCRERRPTQVRELVSGGRRNVSIERCRSCGAHWLREDAEIAMSWDNEVNSYAYALISPQEAAALPVDPTKEDLAFLADRDVLVLAGMHPGAKPVWQKGWPHDLWMQ